MKLPRPIAQQIQASILCCWHSYLEFSSMFLAICTIFRSHSFRYTSIFCLQNGATTEIYTSFRWPNKPKLYSVIVSIFSFCHFYFLSSICFSSVFFFYKHITNELYEELKNRKNKHSLLKWFFLIIYIVCRMCYFDMNASKLQFSENNFEVIYDSLGWSVINSRNSQHAFYSKLC